MLVNPELGGVTLGRNLTTTAADELFAAIYANVLNKTILVPEGSVTSLGSAIFAFLAAKAFFSIEAAQDALCPPFRVFTPEPRATAVYEQLYSKYKQVYFSLGKRNSEPVSLGDVLPELRRIAEHARRMQ